MGIILGIIVASVIWWLLKLSFFTLILFAVIGAVIGAIPQFMKKRAK